MKFNMPSLEDVRAGINDLLVIEKWNNFKILKDPETFYKKVDSLFLKKLGIFPTIIDFHKSDEFPFKFYRLRKEVNGFNSGLISEYSHPPATVVNYFQRANLPKHPVLYCSDNPATAISEVVKTSSNITNKDVYYLSEWDILPQTSIRISPFFFGNLNENSFYKFWSDSNFNRLKVTLTKEGMVDSFTSYEEILRFLSNLFVYENTYVVSSYIAHSHLYAKHTLRSDIFIYPSVQHDRKSVNYAIHPNFVAEKMRLKKVFKMRLEDMNQSNSIKFNLLNFGENKDSIILWNSDFSKNREAINETFPEFLF